LIFAYKKLYVEPQRIEAQEQIFVAQQYFERDSFELALNGDGDYPGFLDIIDDYGSTNVSNLANYYAGVSFFKLGDYESAVDYLTDFSTSDKLLAAISAGCIADSYVELGNFTKAAEYYEDAASESNNTITTPIYLMKLGRVYEELNNWEKALETYEKIEKDFADTDEGRTIQKYITRAKMML
jgi:TolA-binding protein